MYFDTHAHYDDEKFDNDRYEILDLLPENGVELVVNAASDLVSAEKSIILAARYDYIYAAVGVHPHEAKTFDLNTISKLRELSRHKKVVAIGEIGLDYHYDYSPREEQRRALYAQMELAQELGMPVIIHNRKAHEDIMKAIKAFPGVKGVFHCYSGSLEMAREIIDLGWYISFTGSITFKNAKRAPEIVAWLPEDRIMIETDCPYLTPVPKRGERNDSRNLPLIASAVGRIRGITSEEAARLTLENGRRFFGI
ncbi:MAG: TatD family hydrolase [Clostridiales bacterium]|jgi:TatD DNase family protein|nr:TatD family hydrolase [Clostridiales bacterium]